MSESISAMVRTINYECEGILSIRLGKADDTDLPPFRAGAHIDLYLGNGLTRSYSICSSPSQRNYYEIAVGLADNSRGGSRWIHEQLRCGQSINIGLPRNLFAADEGSGRQVLIAGGIGITPLLSMIQQFEQAEQDWVLHYFARSQSRVAFTDYLKSLGDRVHIHVGNNTGDSGSGPRLSDIVVDDGSSHFYCCGPETMLDDFLQRSQNIAGERVHVEHFSADTEVATGTEYQVHLSVSNKTIQVAEGQTLLDSLIESGIDVMHSCREGICGACEVNVLEGDIDHRDHILSTSEKARNKTMFVCCSGSKGGNLTLEI